MGKSNLTFKRTFSIILAYLLSLFLFLFVTVTVLWGTIFSADFHVKNVDRSNFSAIAGVELQQRYVSHGSASGIPENIMKSAIFTTQVDDAIKTNIRALFDDSKTYNYKMYSDNLHKQFVEYAKEAYLPRQEQVIENFKVLADLCTKDFIASTNPEIYSFFTQAILPYKFYLELAILGLAAIVVILSLILIFSNTNLRRLSKYGVYIFGSNIILYFLMPVFVKILGLERLNISPESYNKLFSSLLPNFLNEFLLAIILTMIFFIICITYLLIKSGVISPVNTWKSIKRRINNCMVKFENRLNRRLELEMENENKKIEKNSIAKNKDKNIAENKSVSENNTARKVAIEESKTELPSPTVDNSPVVDNSTVANNVVTTDNVAAADRGFSIVRIMRAFKNKRRMVIAVTMIAFAIGVILSLGYYLYRFIDPGEVSAILSFNYQGVEKGLDPKGRSLDVNMIKSPYVLDMALLKSDLYVEGITTEDIRENITIREMLPNDVIDRMTVIRTIAEKEPAKLEELLDIAYFPTQFKISIRRDGNLGIVNPERMNILLNNILDAYTEYFIDLYSDRYIIGAIIDDFDINDYDYPEVVNILSSQIDNVIAYCNAKRVISPEFRSPSTQVTFADIIANLNLVKSVDVASISALVHTMRLSRDPEKLAMTYEYNILSMEMERKIALQTSKAATEAAKNYQKDTSVIMGSMGETLNVTQSSGVYDSFLRQSVDEAEKANKLKEDINFYKELLKTLETGTTRKELTARKKDFEYADKVIPEIRDTIQKWVKITNDTMDDFFVLEEFKNATRVVIPSHYTKASDEALKMMLMIIAAVTAMGFFFGFLASIWKEAFGEE